MNIAQNAFPLCTLTKNNFYCSTSDQTHYICQASALPMNYSPRKNETFNNPICELLTLKEKLMYDCLNF